jgi:Tfp pilus assembly PilM family ATPase
VIGGGAMPFGPALGGLSAVALDFGSARLHAAQVVRRGRRAELVAAASLPRPAGVRAGVPTAQEATLLADRLWRMGFTGSRAALLPGREALLAATVEVPPRAPAEAARQIERAEVARLTRQDPAALEIATWAMPSTGRKGQPEPMAAVAVERGRIVAVADQLQQAGLDLVHVDADGAVLAAAADAAGVRSADRLCAVLDLGSATSRVVALYGGVAVYERSMPGAGVTQMWTKLARELGIDAADAQRVLVGAAEIDEDIAAVAAGVVAPLAQRLAEDTATAIGYVAHRFRREDVGEIVLAGGGAACGVLTAAIDRRLGVPVRPLTPAAAGIVGNGARLARAAQNPALTAAAVLAARSVGLCASLSAADAKGAA